jgi:hypothetical protein
MANYSVLGLTVKVKHQYLAIIAAYIPGKLGAWMLKRCIELRFNGKLV